VAWAAGDSGVMDRGRLRFENDSPIWAIKLNR
jgi:hypothetical protein